MAVVDKAVVGRTALTLGVAAAGGAAAFALALPAPWLIGAVVAVTAAAAVRLPVMVYEPLRNLAFAVLGVSMGSGVTPETIELARRWPISILALVVCIALIMWSAVAFLTRVKGWDRGTALLASSPGALSGALALAIDGYGDVRRVSLLQSIRLLSLTAVLPLLVDVAAATKTTGAARATLAWPTAIGLIAAGIVLGLILARLRVPAALLVGGMLLSASLHLAGAVTGGPPLAILIPAFLITGAAVGARFAGARLVDLKSNAAPAAVVVLMGAGISGLAAWLVAHVLGLPYGQVWVAFAPGGVEAMAAMALSLGFDPAFVGAHHVLRILAISLLLPLLMVRRGRSQAETDQATE